MEYGIEYTNYQTKRSRVRLFIRRFYINNIVKFVEGKCIDFGCGSGEILEKLPGGSIGTDINKFSVDYCNGKNLNAKLYEPLKDNYKLNCFEEKYYGTIIFSHVLEHIDNIEDIWKVLFQSADRLSIPRIIVVLPGIKGFKKDKTHVTYIDLDYISRKGLDGLSGYKLIYHKYYPINSKLFSKYFTHNELVLIFDN